MSHRSAALSKKRLWHRCPPVSFTKFLRAPFVTENLRWLLFFEKIWQIWPLCICYKRLIDFHYWSNSTKDNMPQLHLRWNRSVFRTLLTLSWLRFLSNSNQSICLRNKSVLCDRELHPQRVKHHSWLFLKK